MNNRILVKNFKDQSSILSILYDLYKEAYNIPVIESRVDLTDEYSFNYCTSRKHFVVVFPFWTNKELLMTETFFDNKVRWLPIAGSVQLKKRENYFDAAIRLSKQVYPTIELGEMEPLAVMENHFFYNGQTCSHFGIAFVARIRNQNPLNDLFNDKTIRGQLISPSIIKNKKFEEPSATQWDKLVGLAKSYVNERNVYTVQEDEIQGYLSKKIRYQIHNLISKPLLRLFGRVTHKYSTKDVTLKIEELVLGANGTDINLIDVACGDNPLVLNLAQKSDRFNLVVANDLSWFQLQDLQKHLDSNRFKNVKSNVVFTNHDAKAMPFKDKYFDVLICKNVLHHMNDTEYLKHLVNEMNRISKKVIVIEVLDPFYEGRWGRYRHKYVYDKLLKEVEAGDNFLSKEAFEEFCKLGNCVEKFDMPTIRAVYQFCVFSNV